MTDITAIAERARRGYGSAWVAPGQAAADVDTLLKLLADADAVIVWSWPELCGVPKSDGEDDEAMAGKIVEAAFRHKARL